MTDKKFDLYLKTFVNLYGVIDSEDAFDIISIYNKEFNKEEFLKKLKKLNDEKYCHFYAVTKSTDKDVYIIASECFFFCSNNPGQDIDELIDEKEDIDYFTTETEKEYLKYADEFFFDNHPMMQDILKRIASIMSENTIMLPIDIFSDINGICVQHYEPDIELILIDLKRMRVKVNKKNMDFVLEIINDVDYITHKWHLNGLTKELTELAHCFTSDSSGLLHLSNEFKKEILSGQVDYDIVLSSITNNFTGKQKDILTNEIEALIDKSKLN